MALEGVARLRHGLAPAARATSTAVPAEDNDIAPHQAMRLVGSQPCMTPRDVDVPSIIAKGELLFALLR